MDYNKIAQNVANYLKLIMELKELNQNNMALQLNISQGKLSKMLNGKEKLKVTMLFEIARIGGNTIDEVINGDYTEKTLRPVIDYSIVNRGYTEKTLNPITNDSIVNNGTITDSVISNDHNTTNNYFNTKNTIKTEVKYDVDLHISEGQAAKLKAIVDVIVELEAKVKLNPKHYAAVWSAFKKYMKVTNYKVIKKEEFFKAEAYLMKWKGRLMKQKSFSNNNMDDYRKKRYTAIYAAAKNQLKMSKQDIEDYVLASFGVTSLNDLSKDQLETLYTRFMSRKYSK